MDADEGDDLEPVWRWVLRVCSLTLAIVFITALTLVALVGIANHRRIGGVASRPPVTFYDGGPISPGGR